MNAYTNLPNLDIESQETQQKTNQGALDRSTIDMENLPMNVSVEDEDRIDADIALSDQLEQGRVEKYNGKLRCMTFMKLMICLCLLYVIFLLGFVMYVIIRMNIESGRQIMTDGSQGLVTEEVPVHTIREPTARLPGTSTSYSVPFAAMVGNFGCDNCVKNFGEYERARKKEIDKARKKNQKTKDRFLNYFMCWVLCCIFIKVLCCSDRR